MFNLSMDLVTFIVFVIDLGLMVFILSGVVLLAERHKDNVARAYRRGCREGRKELHK